MDITLTGTLTNDQTAGLQNDDDAIGGNLSGLLARFANFLNGTPLAGDPAIPGTLALDAGQLAFADSVEGVTSSSLSLTVNPQGSIVDDLFFSRPNGTLLSGDQVFISAGVPLQTLGGDNIYLHSYDNGNIVLATTSATGGSGEVVAAFYLNETSNHLSATVQMVTFMPLKHPDATNPDDAINWTNLLNVSASGSLSFDFDQLKSGSSLWVAVGNSTGGLLVTGGDPDVDSANKKTNISDVIHTSQGGVGATIGVNNQLFDNVGETAVFTLVTGLASLGTAPDAGAAGDYTVDPLPNKKPIEGIDYSGYINTNGAGIFLSQSQGNDPKNLDIKLWEAGGDAGGSQTAEDLTNYIPGLASDTAVTVASVTITDDDGNLVGVWGAGGTLASGASVNDHVSTNGTADIQVSFSGNTIDVNGVLGEYTIAWTSASGETFNRFDIIAQGGQFDVGRVDVDNITGDTQAVGGSLFVDDDGPKIGDSDGVSAGIANSVVDFVNGASTGPITLNGAVGTDTKTSPYSLIDWTGKDAGDPAIVINGVTLTAVPNATGSTPVTGVGYWADTNGSAGIQTGGATPDTEYYRLTLDQTANSGAGAYNFQVLQPPPPAFREFNFDGLASGDHLWVAVGDETGAVLISSGDVVVSNSTGKKANTNIDIHTSQGGDGTTIGVKNQLFDLPGETAVFTLVKDLVALGAGPDAVGDYVVDPNPGDAKPEGIDYDSYLNVTGAGIYLSQSQGTPTAAKNFDINVYNADANLATPALDVEDGFGYVYANPAAKTGDALGNDLTNISITTVTVVDENGDPVGTWGGVGGFANGSTHDGVKITFSNNNIDVEGVFNGYVVNWTTNTAFNRFDVVAEANSNGQVPAFDIGKVFIREGLDTPDQKFDFTAKIIDGDGDSATDSWSVGIDGTGANDDGEVGGVNALALMNLTMLSATMALDSQHHDSFIGM
jgi:hypothetical protein